MSKEKQIAEMARDICESCHDGVCYCDKKPCDLKCEIFTEAQYLYEKGYRKQSEGEWITDEEGYVTCSVCGEEHTWDEFRPPYCDMCGAKMKGGGE
jgi:hypothetical protein